MKNVLVIALWLGLGLGLAVIGQDEGQGGQVIKRLVNSLPDEAFSASSYYDGNGAPVFSRFQSYTTVSNWSARHNSKNQWLKLDLGQSRSIVAVATKGRYANDQQWVASYMISYSLDDKTWTYFGDGPEPHVFKGNVDTNTEVKNKIKTIQARFVRFHPVTWNRHITMRVELFGY